MAHVTQFAPHFQRPAGGRSWNGLIAGAFLGLACLSQTVCSGSKGGTAPDGPSTLAVLEGQGASAPAGTVVPAGPSVRVLDGEGDPVVNAEVSLEVLEGGGRVASSILRTDSRGIASGIWILGKEPGTPQRLRASWDGLSADFTAEAVAPNPSQIYLGRDGYVEYHPGTLPLVLTAPHGGYLKPVEIPDRGWGTTAQDRNTRELALAIREAVHARTGGYPAVIISNLHRSKLDPNREIVEAAQGNPDAERAWWEFQIFADEAGDLVAEAFGEGLHLDIHGHGHEINRLELGYLLTRSDLALPDGGLASSTYVDKSSVRALARKPGEDLADLVRGPLSLGSLLEARFVPAVPSSAQPNPGDEPYFNGGYNTVRHGSRDGGTISAIQIEHYYPGLRDLPENRERYAEILAEVLDLFFAAHFRVPLAPASSSPPGSP